MVEKCVVYGCSNSKNKQKGISIHKIPSDSDPRAEVRRRRQRWIKFVNQTRKHWTPGKTSSICSVHFKHEDFKRPFNSALKGALGFSKLSQIIFEHPLYFPPFMIWNGVLFLRHSKKKVSNIRRFSLARSQRAHGRIICPAREIASKNLQISLT